jgi:ADP-heptose:LPS heptosyltransferase
MAAGERSAASLSTRQRALVIRLGALGDLIQAFDAFYALRQRHADDELVLLTGTPFADFARSIPWFDAVIADKRQRSPTHYWRMGRMLRANGFQWIYDLHNKPRTELYRRLSRVGGEDRTLWLGAAHHQRPMPPEMHNRDRYLAHVEALADAQAAPLDWLTGPPLLPGYGMQQQGERPFVLLVPGASPRHPHKRWPAMLYGLLAKGLWRSGLVPVLIGAQAERQAAAEIVEQCPDAIDLTEATSLGQVAALARRATATVGNDTGPVFLAAAVGCPTLALMSKSTDPARSRPYGPRTAWLRCDDLAALPVATVAERLRLLIQSPSASTARTSDNKAGLGGERRWE